MTRPASLRALPKPARAHDLRQSAGVVAIGLVGHSLHRRIGLTRLDADRWQARVTQTIVKPGRQRTRFQTDALQRQPGAFLRSSSGVR